MADTLNFIDVDYDRHKDAILRRVLARYPSSWNDLQANNVGMLYVDLMAWCMSNFAYLANRRVGEVFTPTMVLRESAVRLGNLVGYTLRGPTAATIMCEAQLSNPLSVDLWIRDGTIVKTVAGVTFEVSGDYVILQNEVSPVEAVVTFSPTQSGMSVLSTYVQVTSGSPYVDAQDSTINLAEYISAGQTFQAGGDSVSYIVSGISSSIGSVSNNRIILSTPYAATSRLAEATVVDRRITLVQGQTLTERFTASNTNAAGMVVQLNPTNIINGSVEVTVNGSSWTSTNSLYLAGPEDAVFNVRTLSTDQVIVQFGDGRFGQSVPLSARVTVQYRVGGGIVGNVPLMAINTSVVGFVTGSSNPQSVLLFNQSSTGQGGQERESLEEARVNIPMFIRANDRAVSIDDWQALARSYSHPKHGSVAYARAVVRTENALLEGNVVVVYAWTTGSSGTLVPLSPALKSALKEHLLTKAVGTDYPLIADGSSRPAPIAFRFKVVDGYDVSAVQVSLVGILAGQLNALRPGDPIIYSNLVRTLDETVGVDSVTMASPIADLVASNPMELFTPLDDSYVYNVDMAFVGDSIVSGDTIATYSANLPVVPLSVWAFRLFIGEDELTIMSDVEAGRARIYRSGVLCDEDSLLSYVDLRTGVVVLNFSSAAGSPSGLTMTLRSVQGYSRDRYVNVYVGYVGEDSVSKRREIRTALQSWGSGLDVGGTLYASEMSGIVMSKSNIQKVVQAISGVTSVPSVTLDTPTNTDTKVSAGEGVLLKLGSIIVNNAIE